MKLASQLGLTGLCAVERVVTENRYEKGYVNQAMNPSIAAIAHYNEKHVTKSHVQVNQPRILT